MVSGSEFAFKRSTLTISLDSVVTTRQTKTLNGCYNICWIHNNFSSHERRSVMHHHTAIYTLVYANIVGPSQARIT